jgi:branched-subunit amino acid aminotransferase/4-amino-4-deoxychorismate lyase
VKLIGIDDLTEVLQRTSLPHQAAYAAMFNSWLGGITTDPRLMLVPVDDHLVHRGDGVFESLKCVDGAIYNMAPHLDRLLLSAAPLALTMPMSRDELENTIADTVRASGLQDAAIRILLSRGPGSFSVSPHDTVGPQLYIIVTQLSRPFMELHPEGAAAARSDIPVKHSMFSGVKSCNYLPNVLMAAEAKRKDVDFVISFDEADHIAEGATENIGIVDADGRLVFPQLGRILRGTTMVRVMELAEALVTEGLLTGVSFGDISTSMLQAAREVLIVGTTRNVTCVRSFDGNPIGAGNRGPVYQALGKRLHADVHGNASRRTPVYN